MKLVATLSLEEIREKGLVRVTYPPFDVLVIASEAGIFAMEDACNHAGASLSDGWVEDTCIVCPVHGYSFELATGELVRPKGMCADQRTFVTRIEGDVVSVFDAFALTIVG